MYENNPYESAPYGGYPTHPSMHAGVSSGVAQPSQSHSPHYHPHQLAQQQLQPQEQSSYSITEVFDPDFKFIYDLPASCVVHLPPARLNITRLVLCRNYRAHESQSCAMGSSCKFVHADSNYAKLEAHPIHVNYIWRHEGLCTYSRLPAGFMFTVWAPNKKPPTSLVPSERVLVTKGSQAHMICLQSVQSGLANPSELDQAAVLSHCAHYYFNRMCNRGERCNFIHTVHVDPNVQGDFKRAPGRSQHHAQAASRAEEAAHAQASKYHHGRGRGGEHGGRSAPATAAASSAAAASSSANNAPPLPPPLSTAAITAEDSDGALCPALNTPGTEATSASSAGVAAPQRAQQRGARPVAAASAAPPAHSTTPSPRSPCLSMPKHISPPPPGVQLMAAPSPPSQQEQYLCSPASERSGYGHAIEGGSPTARAEGPSSRAGRFPDHASAPRSSAAALQQRHPPSHPPLDAGMAGTAMRPRQQLKSPSSPVANSEDTATLTLPNTPSFWRAYVGSAYADPSPMPGGSLSVPPSQHVMQQQQQQQQQQPSSKQPPHPQSSAPETPLVWLTRTESSSTTPIHGSPPLPSVARGGTGGGYPTPSALSADRPESMVNVITRRRRRRDAPLAQLGTTTIPSSLTASSLGGLSSPVAGANMAAVPWPGRYASVAERSRDVNAPMTPLTESPTSCPPASRLLTSGESSGQRQASRPRDSPPGITSLPVVLSVPTGIDTSTVAAGADTPKVAGGRQAGGTTANNATTTTATSEGSLSGSPRPLGTPQTATAAAVSAAAAALQRASARGLAPQSLGGTSQRAGAATRGAQSNTDVLTPTEAQGYALPWPSPSSTAGGGGAVSLVGFSGAVGAHFPVDSWSDEGATASVSVSGTGATGTDRHVHYHGVQQQQQQQQRQPPPQQRSHGMPNTSSSVSGGGGNAAQHPLPPTLLDSSAMSAGGASDASNSNLESSVSLRPGRFRHDPYATSGV